MSEKDSPLMSFPTGCRMLGMDPRTVERIMDTERGFPRAVWISNRRYFFKEQVERYIADLAKQAGFRDYRSSK